MPEIPTFCRVCEPACGLLARVEEGALVGLRPDREHPISRGFACHKGIAGLDVHRDPDRLLAPLARRPDGGFEAVGWDEALGAIGERLGGIRDAHGPDAISAYVGNPTAFNTFAGPGLAALLGALGVRRTFSSGTQDCANKFAAGEAVFGTSTLHPVPDIEHTDHLLLIGENPRVSHMSFISIADPVGAIKRAVRRGAVVRYLNPRRIEHEASGTGEVVWIRPDTDVYLIAAMLDTILREGREDAQTLAEHGRHVDGLRRFAAGFPAERAAGVTGIAAERIRTLAREFAGARAAAVHMSTGANMGRQGTLVYWLVQMLSFATGNLDRRGGNLYGQGFYPATGSGRARPESQFFETRRGRLRRIRGSWPGTLLADEILSGEPRIRALLVVAGNPLLSIAGEPRLREALERLELLVCLDLYRNATGEHAHFVLPCTDAFERPDVNWTGLGLQPRPWVQYTEAVVPPRGACRPEWWILGRLAEAVGGKGGPALEDGPDTGRLEHMLRGSGLDLEALRAAPRGVVLPEPEPGRFYDEWIQTDDRRVDCCPEVFASEGALDRCEAICRELEAEPADQLKLVHLRTPAMHNSWYQNVPRMNRPGRPVNPLFMSPDDARRRGLEAGERVRCRSEWGEVEVELALDADLMPGVVALAHGYGHASAPGLRLASRRPGVNANRLLPSGAGSFEPLSNQAFMTGIPVTVDPAARPAAGTAPRETERRTP